MSREQRAKAQQKQEALDEETFVLGGTRYRRCLCPPVKMKIKAGVRYVRVELDIYPGMCPSCHGRFDPRPPKDQP